VKLKPTHYIVEVQPNDLHLFDYDAFWMQRADHVEFNKLKDSPVGHWWIGPAARYFPIICATTNHTPNKP